MSNAIAEFHAAIALTTEAAKILARKPYAARTAQDRANTIATVGAVEIKSAMGGNTRAQHVRTTFKIDGRRAARDEVLAYLSEES